jgi:hypothetical protein
LENFFREGAKKTTETSLEELLASQLFKGRHILFYINIPKARFKRDWAADVLNVCIGHEMRSGIKQNDHKNKRDRSCRQKDICRVIESDVA